MTARRYKMGDRGEARTCKMDDVRALFVAKAGKHLAGDAAKAAKAVSVPARGIPEASG